MIAGVDFIPLGELPEGVPVATPVGKVNIDQILLLVIFGFSGRGQMKISVLFSVDGKTALVGGAASGMGCTSAEVVDETGGLLCLSSAKKLPEAAGAAGWMVALSRLPC
jgi:hypothetical protein